MKRRHLPLLAALLGCFFLAPLWANHHEQGNSKFATKLYFENKTFYNLRLKFKEFFTKETSPGSERFFTSYRSVNQSIRSYSNKVITVSDPDKYWFTNDDPKYNFFNIEFRLVDSFRTNLVVESKTYGFNLDKLEPKKMRSGSVKINMSWAGDGWKITIK